jgi:hypothetical protein
MLSVVSDVCLKYDPKRWVELKAEPRNTLQLFVTNRCNLRCRGCFFQAQLGSGDMRPDDYQERVWTYHKQIKKVLLLGGEPLLHPQLSTLLDINRSLGLSTTIYTNGRMLDRVRNLNMDRVELRIDVYGATSSEKPLASVPSTDLPCKIVYMLRRDNVAELAATAAMTEERFSDCRGFYISSIRDIAATGNYWVDTAETLSMPEYAEIVQDFVINYTGKLPKLEIATRGILTTEQQNFRKVQHCRFLNLFLNKPAVLCPLDISRVDVVDTPSFGRPCVRGGGVGRCLLQKIVLVRL